ncbi:hypothetical protein L4X63_09435 [Geomonas sp. Red32]|uniref:hypothetical protein n=1 Tax=Geomonas sp. Red32 TaxID=2912856 RepID=UPI00202CE658|nr:hypothetical protein [Geomonas sp. Red32]MCM0081810.1 hypothetical protein [Geomonas sp. Red32]
MFRRGLKRLLNWRKKNLNQERSHRLSDHRIVDNTVRMFRELAGQNQPLTGCPQEASREKATKGPSASAYQEEIDAELDRIFDGRPLRVQRGGRRILICTAPGGNG